MYTVMKNNDKVLYFEVVNNKYVQPISSFNLYDNEGKSLTSVNEHFFMNQLVNRINVACKKGIFISDQEIVDFLNKVKASCEDLELKKLLKGSYINEINEFNFENNKRNIVRYLDKFKFDTFVDYNNVSVFSGSLEKNGEAQPVTEPTQESIQPVEPVVENVVQQPAVQENVQDVALNNSDDMEVVEVVDEPVAENVDSSTQQPETNNSVGLDFMNIPVDNSVGDVVSSSDYFSNSQSAPSVAPAVPVQSESLDFNSLYGAPQEQQVQPTQDAQVQPTVQENTQPVAPVQENVQPVVESQTIENVQPIVDQPVMPISEPVVQPTAPVVDAVQESPSLQPESSPVDLTAPLDFNSLYGSKESDPVPAPVVQTTTPVAEAVQENPALQPATSSVDLTAPLDFNALYSNTESAPMQRLSQMNMGQENIQMIPNSDFSTPQFNGISDTNISPISNDGLSTQTSIANDSLNQSVDENSFPNDGFSLAEPLMDNVIENPNSYVDAVRDRLQNANNGLGVMNPNVGESDLEKTVVVDKVNMPPLESVPDEKPKKSKEKKSFGVVIFIIVLLLILAGFAYFLYNYIF